MEKSLKISDFPAIIRLTIVRRLSTLPLIA
jgi:hypothetical protein